MSSSSKNRTNVKRRSSDSFGRRKAKRNRVNQVEEPLKSTVEQNRKNVILSQYQSLKRHGDRSDTKPKRISFDDQLKAAAKHQPVKSSLGPNSSSLTSPEVPSKPVSKSVLAEVLGRTLESKLDEKSLKSLKSGKRKELPPSKSNTMPATTDVQKRIMSLLAGGGSTRRLLDSVAKELRIEHIIEMARNSFGRRLHNRQHGVTEISESMEVRLTRNLGTDSVRMRLEHFDEVYTRMADNHRLRRYARYAYTLYDFVVDNYFVIAIIFGLITYFYLE